MRFSDPQNVDACALLYIQQRFQPLSFLLKYFKIYGTRLYINLGISILISFESPAIHIGVYLGPLQW